MKQADLGLDVDQLLERQAWLQQRVRRVDARTGLTEVLGRVGRARIGGSFETGLMVWPDIDLTVVTTHAPRMHDVLSAAERLVERAGITRFDVADHRDEPAEGAPRGVLLGPTLRDDDLTWQVDIWFTDEVEERARRALVDRITAGLTDETRRAILAIKQVAAASDHYHRGISSVDLYLAVIDHDVRTPDQFAAHLAASGRAL